MATIMHNSPNPAGRCVLSSMDDQHVVIHRPFCWFAPCVRSPLHLCCLGHQTEFCCLMPREAAVACATIDRSLAAATPPTPSRKTYRYFLCRHGGRNLFHVWRECAGVQQANFSLAGRDCDGDALFCGTGIGSVGGCGAAHAGWPA